MPPAWYPASTQPITVSLINSNLSDRKSAFWQVESEQIRSAFATAIRPRIQAGEIKHLSVFAIAPQPLLILLGTELSELVAGEVYQRRKEPAGSWAWDPHPDHEDFLVEEPQLNSDNSVPALVFSLSGTIVDDRIHRVLGSSAAIWRVSIAEPNNDFVRSRGQVADFKRVIRPLLDRIKRQHGDGALLHVFPAMPVSLAVEFGRTINAKADLPMLIYDQQSQQGGFVEAVTIGLTNGK